jgi:valyl-tRNA synthetase
MGLAKKFDFMTVQEGIRSFWEERGTNRFEPSPGQPVYAIDTPPPTVSGKLHLGHLYSYSHADFFARFQRMNGRAVFYPMGFDDNGLPTEQLVERELGSVAEEMDRATFVEECLRIGERSVEDYRALWQQLGLSIDWRHTYRTVGKRAQRISQLSFVDLYEKGLVYRREAPVTWCPKCATAIAQAEMEEMERESVFYELAFAVEGGESLRIATTRPELLPACVAVFVHPEDGRYQRLIGQRARLPLTEREVPILADENADPEKGTGVVMCCTFGDAVDVVWWRTHGMPLIKGIERDGRMGGVTGEYAGLTVEEARERIVGDLGVRGKLLGNRGVAQAVRVHERCDTPVEYVVAPQWFVRVLDFKEEWRRAGEEIAWNPPQMKNRFLQWVESVSWDWCISRQRFFGVPFPVWHCASCGEVRLAQEEQLPIDPTRENPSTACVCGGEEWVGETDVMDTWATSSLTPQIVGGWDGDPELYGKVFPMGLRPQAHEIIRTWAFYTIVKAHHHWGKLPWRAVAISGWGLASEGEGKISKSRGGGPISPGEVFAQYPVDAVRYWAASTGLGKDAIISMEKIQAGDKLVTKLWNVARFCERFIGDFQPPEEFPALSPADSWILSRLQVVIERVSDCLGNYDYATAKSEVETFFWRDLADNYLEMAKKRLYGEDGVEREGARFALFVSLRDVIKLFAPFLPYVTEAIYRELFARKEGEDSVHLASWPKVDDRLLDDDMESIGNVLIGAATAVRRYKSEAGLPLGRELARIQVILKGELMNGRLQDAGADIASITRAQSVEFVGTPDPELDLLVSERGIEVAVEREGG